MRTFRNKSSINQRWNVYFFLISFQSLPPLDESAEEEHAFDENGDAIVPPEGEGVEGAEGEASEGGKEGGEGGEVETPAEGAGRYHRAKYGKGVKSWGLVEKRARY